MFGSAAHVSVQEKDWELEGLAVRLMTLPVRGITKSIRLQLTKLARYFDKIAKLPHTFVVLCLAMLQLTACHQCPPALSERSRGRPLSDSLFPKSFDSTFSYGLVLADRLKTPKPKW